MKHRHLFLLLTSCAIACSPLVEDGYLGDPLFEFEGRVDDYRDLDEQYERLQTSLFWTWTGDTAIAPSDMAGQSVLGMSISFPETVALRVYSRPVLPASRNYAIGVILLWDDLDNDGIYDSNELRGGAYDDAVIFAEQPLTAEASPTSYPIPPGFSTIPVSVSCDGSPELLPANDPTCGVPLGAACRDDQDCGTGTCIQDDGYLDFPGGYCVLRIVEGGCVPANGYWHGISTATEDYLAWVRRCEDNAPCRTSEGYVCVPNSYACLPPIPVRLVVWNEFELAPLCDHTAPRVTRTGTGSATHRR